MKGAVRESKTDLRFHVYGDRGVPVIFTTLPEAATFALISSAATHRDITIDVICPTRAAARKYAGERGVKKFDAMLPIPGAANFFERYKLPPIEYIGEENVTSVHKAQAVKRGETVGITYGNGAKSAYRVLHVFATKGDADGPLPKDLLRIIVKKGGAAVVELVPPKGAKLDGDMIVGPNSSRPRFYVMAIDASGRHVPEPGGYPVALKPPQVKRLFKYLRERS